ncbi:MAG TPA: hypothetical protein VFB38_16955 [Chthonomonadaceae bacterium]|nr:hypothetical protein [Chthonomonadaceae bacterium]
MNRTHRLTALALAAVMGVGIVTAPLAARASEQGRRNTAIALGAAAVGLLLTQKNKLPGIVAGVGAAYAYKRYNDAVSDRHRREREYGYYDDNDYYRQDRYRYHRDRNDYGDYDDRNYRDDNYRRNDDNCRDNGYSDNGYYGNDYRSSRTARRGHSRYYTYRGR